MYNEIHIGNTLRNMLKERLFWNNCKPDKKQEIEEVYQILKTILYKWIEK